VGQMPHQSMVLKNALQNVGLSLNNRGSDLTLTGFLRI
jgi:hypothetical protein